MNFNLEIGNHKKKIFSDEQKQYVINEYQNGKGKPEIGREFGVTHKIIERVLKEEGVETNFLSHRTYKINEMYFDEIDTPNKAYILGFFYADGSVSLSKGTVSMSLQEEDGYILERIREEVNSEKPLEYLDYSNKHDFGYSYKNQYRLLFFSVYMCKSLINLGMVPNKSLILEFPKIRQDLIRHFVRGYFDGDGSFCPHLSLTGKFQPLISFISTENFCKTLQETLIRELDIAGGNIYDASCHNGITRVLSISGGIQTKKILDWMYTDADMYLIRKYEKYRNSFYDAA